LQDGSAMALGPIRGTNQLGRNNLWPAMLRMTTPLLGRTGSVARYTRQSRASREV
jgi:hypothetical protein